MNSWDSFVNKIGLDRISILQDRYTDISNKVIKYDDSTDFSTIVSKTLDSKYFDEFSDNQSSKRIVDYIKSLS